MSSQAPPKIEHAFYLAILVLALAVRLIGLGAAPLTEAEAQQALPAYQLAQGTDAALGTQPGYVILTAGLFSLLGDSDFLARLWPALFGAALALLPYFWRETIGRKAALLLALGLALDPGLLAFSRAADGLVIGLAAALYAALAWREGQGVWAGILSVIALYSSPHIYIGVLAFGLAWLALGRVAGAAEQRQLQSLLAGDEGQRRNFWIAAALAIVLGASFLLRVPAGLAAIVGPLAGVLARLGGGGDALSLILLAVLAYGLLPLVFGRINTLRQWRALSPFGRFLTLFAVAALLLVMINPGRRVADLIWFFLPLWVLAAQRIARYLRLPDEERFAAFGQALLILLLSTFLLLNLARLSSLNFGDGEFNVRLVTAGGVLALAILATMMIAGGWSRQATVYGLTWSFATLFFLAMLAAGWRLAARPANAANDLWLPGPAAGEARLLQSEVEDISEMQSGEQHQLAVDVNVQSAALDWTLRDFSAAPANDGEAVPVIIAAVDDPQPVEAAYRGQNIVWQVQRLWGNGWPDNVFGWLLYRRGLTNKSEVLMWARADLFPGYNPDAESETNSETDSP